MEIKEKEEYIPKNLDEAIQFLKESISEEELQLIKEEKLSARQAHFGTGTVLRNNWGLWSGSELREWFFNEGIHHPDDMSDIILNSLDRDIRGEDRDLENQKKVYYKHWKKYNINPLQKIREVREDNE